MMECNLYFEKATGDGSPLQVKPECMFSVQSAQ
jgi:hypothetical protein